jgi:hypothetical protein
MEKGKQESHRHIQAASCKASGVEPREWLENVLERMPYYETGKRDITELLPRNWKNNQTNRKLF